MVFDRDKVIAELERFIQFSRNTELRIEKEDDFSASGHKAKSFFSYPPGTPGVHLYWDSEIENIQSAKLLLEYFKDWVDIKKDAFPRLPFQNYVKTKINTMNYILLNPQFENVIVGETNRGVELLLILVIKDDWKKIYCYDERSPYGKLIQNFFNNDKIIWHQQITCYYDFNLLQEDDYLFVLNHSLGWGTKHWVTCPKVKMIIKDGIVVDPTQHWKNHMPAERIDKVYDELQEEIRKKYGQTIFDLRT